MNESLEDGDQPVAPKCQKPVALGRCGETMVASIGSWSGLKLYRCPRKFCRSVIYEGDR